MKTGIDISHYQNVFDWKQVKTFASFVFIKITEGAQFQDPKYKANLSGALAEGLEVEPYTFFRPDSNWLDAIDLLLADVKGSGIKKLMFDLEWCVRNGVEKWDQYSEQYIEQQLRAMTSKAIQAGYEVVIYTTKSFIKQYLPHATWLGEFELFLAGDDPANLPPHWSKFTYWQKPHPGQVPGIEGDVDIDVMNV